MWVNDWYNPTEDLPSAEFLNIKLKGWYQEPSEPKKDFSFRGDDVLDLSKWKYYNEVPLIDHTQPIAVSSSTVDGTPVPSSQARSSSYPANDTKGVSFADELVSTPTGAGDETPILAHNQGDQKPSLIKPHEGKEVGQEFDNKEDLKKSFTIDNEEGQVASISEAGLEPESEIK